MEFTVCLPFALNETNTFLREFLKVKCMDRSYLQSTEIQSVRYVSVKSSLCMYVVTQLMQINSRIVLCTTQKMWEINKNINLLKVEVNYLLVTDNNVFCRL